MTVTEAITAARTAAAQDPTPHEPLDHLRRLADTYRTLLLALADTTEALLRMPLHALNVVPGDRVLLTTPDPWTDQQVNDSQAWFAAAWPGVQFTVVSGIHGVVVQEHGATGD